MAIAKSGVDQIRVKHRPRLLYQLSYWRGGQCYSLAANEKGPNTG